MDNLGYQSELEKGTELEVVQLKGKIITASTSNGTTIGSSQGTTSCASEVCRTARQRRAAGGGGAPNDDDGPWHRKKTIFLIGILVLMLIWIIVYATLSEMKKLW